MNTLVATTLVLTGGALSSTSSTPQTGTLESTAKLSVEMVIKAWKSPDFLATLSKELREAIPDNPAGALEVPGLTKNQVKIAENPESITPCYSISPCGYTIEGATCSTTGCIIS